MAIKSGGFLDQIVRKIRRTAKDPSSGAEYSTESLHLDYITPNYDSVTQEILKANPRGTTVLSTTISLTDGTRRYELPPHLNQVVGVGRFDSEDRFVWVQDYKGGAPRTSGRGGPGWWVDGNDLVFEPIPEKWDNWFRDGQVDVLFKPGSFVPTHEGTGTGATSSTFTLADTPAFGPRSRLVNAYAGYTLRIDDPDVGRIYDHKITAYDPVTREVTVRDEIPAGVVNDSDARDYEILPPLGEKAWNAVAIMCAAEILAARNSNSGYQNQMQILRHHIGTLRNQAVQINGPGNARFQRTRYSGDPIMRAVTPSLCWYT